MIPLRFFSKSCFSVSSDIVLKKINNSKDYKNSFFKFTQESQWSPGISDAELYLDQENTDCFVGYLNQKPILCFAYFHYKRSSFIYSGTYYCIPELRNKNIVFPIRFQKHFEMVLGYGTHAMCGTQEMALKYQQVYGANILGKIYRRNVMIDFRIIKGITSPRVKEANENSIDKLLSYDFQAAGYYREHVIKKFLKLRSLKCLIYENEMGQIQGYIVLRKTVDGYKISPLLADTELIAEVLLGSLKSTISNKENPVKLIADVPEIDGVCHKRFWDREGFSFDQKGYYYIQSTKTLPNNWQKTFAVWAVDAGY